jgi:hypothetical protein
MLRRVEKLVPGHFVAARHRFSSQGNDDVDGLRERLRLDCGVFFPVETGVFELIDFRLQASLWGQVRASHNRRVFSRSLASLIVRRASATILVENRAAIETTIKQTDDRGFVM